MKLNFFKKNTQPKPTTKVYRKKIVEGYSIPAFIKNGTHFFVDLDIYEDGRVECWNFEDFEYFKSHVQNGWVALHIPNNEEISIHNLGSWIIDSGEWLFDKTSFIDYAYNIVKQLNPKMANIYKHSEKTINGVHVGESGNGTIYKELKEHDNDFFPERIDGDSVDMFYKSGENYFLVRVNVFADNTMQLSRLEEPINISLDELEGLIKQEKLLTDIPLNSKVIIHGLGKFTIHSMNYVTQVDDLLNQIKDIVKTLSGEQTSSSLCVAAYQQYLDNPTTEHKDKLRTAYESVPEHLKMYLGDMDTKDVPIRMIIYGEDEIKNWSHYMLAESMEDELPSIDVPKPKNK